MFFYLIQSSTLIEPELDKNTKMIKIFLYGGISYIILHATLFIGGEEALLYSLKNYFWLFLLLDITTIFLINNKDINIGILNNFLKKNIVKKGHKKGNKKVIPKKIEKKVHFAEENEYSSDSDSDIGTDVDFEEFKQSLTL
jgi:hypothetical protein